MVLQGEMALLQTEIADTRAFEAGSSNAELQAALEVQTPFK